ncbi:MAG TPA: lipoyl synthase [Dissulfurispiraceae bacterium]|nr:lipoyl synthase [Dissulfurispiraceae bacterium]
MRLPDWIRSETKLRRHRNFEGIRSTKRMLRQHRLLSVCEEAKCPNRELCFSKPTATFMILGDICTRNCAFCAVKSGIPSAVNSAEPDLIADAAQEMGLKYVVITSVTRDDLPDGGAAHFACMIRTLRLRLPEARVEVLVPDFRGDAAALEAVIGAGPDVFNHNMETVKRLYPTVRPQAGYARSLDILRKAKEIEPGTRTKSGFMLGLGETDDEVLQLLGDLRAAGCDSLTIGQYLRPAKKNLPVVEYITPRAFEDLGTKALGMGFSFVASGPLVRSSMNAAEMYYRDGTSRNSVVRRQNYV